MCRGRRDAYNNSTQSDRSKEDLMVPITTNVQARPRSLATGAFIGAAAATALSGAVLAIAVQPATDLSDKFWRYPWSSSGAFVAFSIFSAVLHGLVVVGLLAFGRSGTAGRSRAATSGVALAVAGTALLLVGELASIPIRHAEVDDTSAMIVGAIFGLASVASMIGFLLSGRATLRAGVWHGWRRFIPLATGIWLVVLTPIGLAAPTLLPSAVGVYGLCLLAMAVALHTKPTPMAVHSDLVAAGIPGVERQLERS
jgi:MFS family permease